MTFLYAVCPMYLMFLLHDIQYHGFDTERSVMVEYWNDFQKRMIDILGVNDSFVKEFQEMIAETVKR